jgi:hypothetical protein
MAPPECLPALCHEDAEERRSGSIDQFRPAVALLDNLYAASVVLP